MPSTKPDAKASTSSAAIVGRHIAIAAVLIALGNIASRFLGQIRESVTSGLFGATSGIDASAYALASRVPTTLYDFLIGGLVSAALIPVFAELAERDERELGVVAGTIFTVATLFTVTAVALGWIFAPQIGTLLTLSTTDPQLRATTITLIRWMLPATVLMASSGLITGLLQARQKFLLPAFATAVFNVGIILGAALLHRTVGIRSLAIGMLLGACFQVLLQFPGLRGTPLRVGVRLNHPDVRRIGRLYVPVLIGLSFALVGTAVDAALASGVSQGAPAIMRYATTLIQLSLGIISTAVALASLPTLSRHGDDEEGMRQYRRTLALTLKVVMFLILPATALLAALARPVIVLLFQQGAFGAQDTAITTRALLFYLPSLIAAGIDQPLIFAFYARKNTLLPNLVNGVAIAMYLVVAFSTVKIMGVYGLILANGMQWGMHALLMLWFAHRRLDALRNQALFVAFGRGAVASIGAGVMSSLVVMLLFGSVTTKSIALTAIVVAGSIGAVTYLLLARLLRLEAWELFLAGVRGRLRRGRPTSP